jgi:outer membrane protein assembly factor BamE (lipoprotein component of BamABCDE complex)
MKIVPTVLVVLAVAGCSSIPVPSSVRVGESQSDVRAKLGAPATERKLASGDTAWYYITGPSGFFTYRAVFGSGGSVSEYMQVLTMQHLMALPQGASRETVLDALGPPMERMTFLRTRTEAWTYRWLDGTFPMIADATFQAGNGTLIQVTVHRDPVFTDVITP